LKLVDLAEWRVRDAAVVIHRVRLCWPEVERGERLLPEHADLLARIIRAGPNRLDWVDEVFGDPLSDRIDLPWSPRPPDAAAREQFVKRALESGRRTLRRRLAFLVDQGSTGRLQQESRRRA
jgi:hypothetical protein